MSLGGSVIVPKGIDIKFLKNFKEVIEKFIKKKLQIYYLLRWGKFSQKLSKFCIKDTKIE